MLGLTTAPPPSTGRRPLPRPPAGLIAAAFGVALIALWRHGALLDLHIYRLGGQSARRGGGDLYTLRDQATGLPFTYPPFAALLFAPLAMVAEPVAAVVITLLSLLAVIRLTGLVTEQFDLRAPQRSRVAGLVLIAFLASEPVISTVLFGQVNLILLALIAQAWLRPHGRWALIGLGLAAGIKLTPAIFIVGLFACGRWRDGLRASIAAAATVLIGAVYLGRSTQSFFGGQGFQDTRIGGTVYVSNQSLNAILWRLFGPGGDRVLWWGLSLVLLAASLWTARIFAAGGQSLLALSTVALAGLLVSPVSWTHHWVIAVPLAAALAQPAVSGGYRFQPGRQSPAGRRALALVRTRWRLVLAAIWLAVTSSWLIWMVPRGGDVEYHQNAADALFGDAYFELAVLTLVLLTVHAARTSSPGARRLLPLRPGRAGVAPG